MKANCWFGKHDMRVVDVPDPEIINPHDAIVKITSTAICGSDLHLYNGFVPTMEKGDIVGHEFMGEVVEIGPEVKKKSRSAIASWCLSRFRAANVFSARKDCSRCAKIPIPMPWKPS